MTWIPTHEEMRVQRIEHQISEVLQKHGIIPAKECQEEMREVIQKEVESE